MRERIMTVDNSASTRQLITFTLLLARYEVDQAVDGVEALQRLRQSSSDLVITALNMPHLDGIALIKGLRSSRAYRFVPIIMHTSESQDVRKQEAKEAGASEWLVKPFTSEQILAVVRRLLL